MLTFRQIYQLFKILYVLKKADHVKKSKHNFLNKNKQIYLKNKCVMLNEGLIYFKHVRKYNRCVSYLVKRYHGP